LVTLKSIRSTLFNLLKLSVFGCEWYTWCCYKGLLHYLYQGDTLTQHHSLLGLEVCLKGFDSC
jgi:hypothetical protein